MTPHVMAARLVAQAGDDCDRLEALLLAAEQVALRLGHPLAGKRLRQTLAPSLARERRTLNQTARREDRRAEDRRPAARPAG